MLRAAVWAGRCRRAIVVALVCAVGVTLGVAGAEAQAGGEQRLASGPMFLMARPGATGEGAGKWQDASRLAVLQRRIALDLRGVPLGQALAEVGRKAGLRVTYSPNVIRADAPVNLSVPDIKVGAALSALLYDAGVDVLLTPSGQAAIVKRVGAVVQGGTVTGRVSDAKTGEALVGAEVYLEGTRWRATTTHDGRYQLAEVTPGSYTLAARRVGYGKQSRAVVVAAEQEVTVDVALLPVATQLTELVTTVTGEQRRLELGHVVGRINADSLVKEAPVASLSELLTARVPGLQVFQNSGLVGSNVTLQIRGPNSLLLSNEPVVIIDGVRYTKTRELGTVGAGLGVGITGRSSPLNHVNVNDIESIEVVKGPSAATLYGTDAANGVLVITTKRGQAGPARWSLYANGSTTTTPKRGLQDGYWGWGTQPNGTPFSSNCTLNLVASGLCRQDSITVLSNPANDPELSVLGAAPRYEYGLNVAGGPQTLRYYVSADLEDATGPIQIPPTMVEQLLARRGLRELPEEWRKPNAQTRLNLRTNLTAVLSPTAELLIHAGYVHGTTRALRSTGGYSTLPTGTPANGPYSAFTDPTQQLLETSTEATERVLGSGSGQWRPAAWLTLRATVGLDLNHGHRGTLSRRGDRPNDFQCSLGCVFDERLRQVATSADLGATAIARRGRLSWRTSVGAQYTRTLNDALGSQGTDLTPGGTSVVHAAVRSTAQVYSEAVTLGSYVEETMGLNSRLFLTGALRVDGASTFGAGYEAAAYPKVNASWLLSEEPFFPRLPGLTELRLRYAFGASGRQPNPRWAGPQFATSQVGENGQLVTAVRVTSLGNPALRPERVREHEFGFDATALGNRLGLELTWLRRHTRDQIAQLTLEPGLFSNFTNLGLTTQRGFEAQLRVGLVESRLLRWDVTLQHSVYRTQLEDLGGAVPQRSFQGGYVEGYPLGARFDRVIVGYTDTNGDGIISSAEVQRSDTAVYVGENTPPQSQTLTSVLGFFDGQLRLSAVLDRHTGFTQQVGSFGCGNLCRAAVDPSTPLDVQAQIWRNVYQPGDYTRLQEVSAAVDLPRRLIAGLRVRSATLVISARNLALWSNSSRPDPGIGALFGLTISDGSIPLGRTWALRMNVGF